MWYAITGEDVPDSLPLRKQLRPAHLERIQQLSEQDRVLAAGPLPAEDTAEPTEAGFTGSIMIVDFPSLDEAIDWANQDPYAIGGVFANVTVKPFIKVLP